MRSVGFWVWLGLYCCSGLFANTTKDQRHLGSATLADLGYQSRRWSVDEGLPSGFVFSVVQTPDGYIWASTLNGVSRCDGVKFTAFPDPEPENLQSRMFRRPDLKVDESGKLWVISREGGTVVHRSEGQFVRLPKSEISGSLIRGSRSESPYIRELVDQSHNEIFIYRKNGDHFEKLTESATPNLGKLVQDPYDQSIWGNSLVRSQHGKLLQLKNGDFEEFPLNTIGGSGTPNVLDIFFNDKDEIIALTHIGLFVRQKGIWKLKREIKIPLNFHRPLTTITDVFQNLWIISNQKILVIDRNGSSREIEVSDLGMVTGQALLDREGSLWIPTQKGLIQLIPSTFTSWSLEPEGGRQKVYTVSEDGDGRVWFAAEKGLYQFAPGSSGIALVEPSKYGFLSVHGNRTGGAYAVDVLNRLMHTTSEKTEEVGKIARGKIFQLTRDGTIWSGSATGMIGRPPNGGELQKVDFVPPDKEVSVEHMVEDSEGKRFVTIRGGGIFQLDDVPEPTLVSAPPESPISKRPTSLHADPEDRIWIISRGPNGIGFWDQKTQKWSFAEWETLTLPFVPPTNSSIVTDKAKGVWIVTVSGLLRCDRSDLAAAISQGGGKVDWKQFDRSDGLPTVACSYTASSSYLDQHGRLWIPTNQGVAMTRPAEWQRLQTSIPPPPVVFKSLLLDGEPRSLQAHDELKIAPGVDLLEIGYQALHYANPSRVSYRYRLSGVDARWTSASSPGIARYQNLPPGSYQFEITADNGHGIWNEEISTLSFIIEPEWWETIWFRTGAVALIILLIFGAAQWRLRSVRNRNELLASFSMGLIDSQERERKRVAGELHDSLGQEMLVLKGRLDIAALKHPEMKSTLKGLSTDFSDTIEQARALSHDLRPPHLEHLGLSQSLEAKAVEVQNASTLEVITHIDELDPRLDPSVEIGLFRIAQEALANVMKHAGANLLCLTLQEDQRMIALKIEDDGCGFHPDLARTQSLGLNSMAERAHLLGASFDCDSPPGRGTRLTVKLKRPPHTNS